MRKNWTHRLGPDAVRQAWQALRSLPAENVFFGYSYYNTDLSSIDRANTNGWELSVERQDHSVGRGSWPISTSHYGSQKFPLV